MHVQSLSQKSTGEAMLSPEVRARQLFWRKVFRQTWLLILVFLGAILFLVPWVWMILTAGKEAALIWRVPPVWIPPTYRWENFIEAWQKGDFLTFYINTTFISSLNQINNHIKEDGRGQHRDGDMPEAAEGISAINSGRFIEMGGNTL